MSHFEMARLSDEEKAILHSMCRTDGSDFRPTGAVLVEHYGTGETVGHIVYTGPYTRHMSVRDCGDHYILARYSQYDRLDYDLVTITHDVDDA